jgi:hypothetical protein
MQKMFSALIVTANGSDAKHQNNRQYCISCRPPRQELLRQKGCVDIIIAAGLKQVTLQRSETIAETNLARDLRGVSQSERPPAAMISTEPVRKWLLRDVSLAREINRPKNSID